MRQIVILLTVLLPVSLFGAFKDLIPAADGSSVLFEARTGFTSTGSYRLRMDQGHASVNAVSRPLADANVDGSTIATSFYGQRRCGFAGSTCFLAAACRADFNVTGPGIQVSASGRRTLIRLNRAGKRAWIEQSDSCADFMVRNPPQFQGLYELPGLTPVVAAGGAKLANARLGRRLITDSDQALTFAAPANIQLQLLGATGAHPIRHQYGAAEAVIDSGGNNVVYLDAAPFGRLHWIDLVRQTEDDLGGAPVVGTAPAISDDGRVLVFLDRSNHLQLYRRDTRMFSPLGRDAVNEFVLAGNGQFVFAANADGRLLRFEVANGMEETWLEPLPELEDASALSDVPGDCPLICYTPQSKELLTSATSVVLLRGNHLDQPGWHLRIGDREVSLQPIGSNSAWFQAPADLAAADTQTLILSKPGYPLQFATTMEVADRLVTCLGSLHEAFDGTVSSDHPAHAGEAVHVFLTGLQGTEPIAVGLPNPTDHLIPIASPPALNPSGGLVPVFFGLAPGLIGIQQLDIRVQQSVRQTVDLFGDSVRQLQCQAPATAP